MARVTAPLLSFGSSGQIGKSQVYSTWRGLAYARRHVIPANPQTSEQTKTRSVFSYLVALWKQGSTIMQAPWLANSVGQPYTDRNAFLKANITALRTGADLTAFVGSPGSAGGIGLDNVSAAGGVGTIDVTVVVPALPTGWTQVAAAAVAIVQGDPHLLTDFTSVSNEDTTDPFAPAFAGLAAGTYVVSAWAKYTRPDGKTAYSPSKTTTVIVT